MLMSKVPCLLLHNRLGLFFIYCHPWDESDHSKQQYQETAREIQTTVSKAISCPEFYDSTCTPLQQKSVPNVLTLPGSFEYSVWHNAQLQYHQSPSPSLPCIFLCMMSYAHKSNKNWDLLMLSCTRNHNTNWDLQDNRHGELAANGINQPALTISFLTNLVAES